VIKRTNSITGERFALDGVPTPRMMAVFLASLACALFALIGLPGAAQAQSNTTSVDTSVGLIEPLTITKLSDLDFGKLVVTTGGTVVMTPTVTPTCSTTGGVIHTAECEPAVFGGASQFGERVRIRRPVGRTVTLTGPGADMTITNITINGDPTLIPVQSNPNWERFLVGSLDGTFVFRVAGTLNVNAGQLPGVYTGTFDIRLDYQ
jgi:hypothetical protein